VLILLQPYTPATFTKTLQRVAGTVLGGIVAALLVAGVHHAAAATMLATLLAGVSAAVLQLNYALFSFFLTPTFVLLAEINAHDGRLAEVRIVNTLIGGVLAFAGARLLWPHRERTKLPDAIAGVLGELRRYLAEIVRVIVARLPPPAPSLTDARRRLGLSCNAADQSFQRLLAERAGGSAAEEPIMTLLLYARRFGGTLGAAASARAIAPAPAYGDAFARFAPVGDAVLAALAQAVRAGSAPAPLPSFDTLLASVDAPLVKARLGRLVQQLTVLHQAVARWHRTF
jgi:uncharacterized membrane protein YccC